MDLKDEEYARMLQKKFDDEIREQEKRKEQMEGLEMERIQRRNQSDFLSFEFIFDTNIFLKETFNSIISLMSNHFSVVHVPQAVLNELDSLEKVNNPKKYKSKEEFERRKRDKNVYLKAKGVHFLLDQGRPEGDLRVCFENEENTSNLDNSNLEIGKVCDTRILNYCQKVFSQRTDNVVVGLISDDRNLRIRSKSLGKKFKVFSSIEEALRMIDFYKEIVKKEFSN